MANYTKKENGTLVEKQPCIHDGCSSSDGMAVYEHKDGSHSTYCFVCKGSTPNYDFENRCAIVQGSESGTKSSTKRQEEDLDLYRSDTSDDDEFEMGNVWDDVETEFDVNPSNNTNNTNETKNKPSNIKEKKMSRTVEDIKNNLTALDNPSRCLLAADYEVYGVVSEMSKDGKQIAGTYYPVYKNGKLTGYKGRTLNQEGKLKNFGGAAIGDRKGSVELFGQHLFTPPTNVDWKTRIIVTEGEEDCITLHKITKMFTKNGIPVVSLPNGACVKSIEQHQSYLRQYDNIILCFDNDDAGRKVTDDVLEVLKDKEVFTMSLPKDANGKMYKDVSEFWTDYEGELTPKTLKEKAEQLKVHVNQPKQHTSTGIINLLDPAVRARYTDREEQVKVTFPKCLGDLNEMTNGGFVLGEIVNIGAASSTGKSSVIKEIVLNTLLTTNEKIGIFSLEENMEDFIEGLTGMYKETILTGLEHCDRDFNEEFDTFEDLISIKVKKVVGDNGEIEFKVTKADKRGERNCRILFYDKQGSCDGADILSAAEKFVDVHGCKIIIVDPVQQALIGSKMNERDFCTGVVNFVKNKGAAWFNIHHVRKSSGGNKANSEGGDLSEEDFLGSGSWFQVGFINLLMIRNKLHEVNRLRNTIKLKLSKCRRAGGTRTGWAGCAEYNPETGRMMKGVSISEYNDIANAMGSEGNGGSNFGVNVPKAVKKPMTAEEMEEGAKEVGEMDF